MQIEKLFDRAVEVASAPAVGAIKQRLATTASELSLAGNLQASLDVCTSAIFALISVLYDVDSDGSPANYDMATHRLLIRPLPWGESGSAKWGLRRWEGQCLRRLLLDRVNTRRRLPSLFDYSPESRQWFVAADVYTNVESATSWLKKDGPSLAEWRSIVTDYRVQAADRMVRKRSHER